MVEKSRIAWFSSGILIAFWFLAVLPKSRWHQLSYGLAIAGALVGALALVGYCARRKTPALPGDLMCGAAGLLVMDANLYLLAS